jgi:hypothetical protein
MSVVDSSAAGSRPSFGLKSLFIVLTVAAVVVTPVRWFGGAYLVCALFSIALIVGCWYAYGRERRPAAAVVAIVGLMISVPLAIAVAIFCAHAFFNLLLCGVLVIVRPRRTAFAISLIGLMVVVYGFAFREGAAELQRLDALRAQYPFESLAKRLEFERKSSAVKTSPQEKVFLAADVKLNLDEQDDRYDASRHRRAWALRELHEETYNHFASAAGFGYSRMPSIQRLVIDWEPRSPLVMPYTVGIESTSDSAALHAVHTAALDSFIASERQGFVRSVDEVAGFESHGPEEMYHPGRCGCDSAPQWQVSRLELVSLLRHQEPRVYVAETMPTMDQLADVPHRPLDDFEKRSLPQLTTQKDIVFRDDTDRLLMLGAVRAGKTCLECHEGTRGKLLGAFSYAITPIEKPEEPEAAPPKTQSVSNFAQAN